MTTPRYRRHNARTRITDRGALFICAATFAFIILCNAIGVALYAH